MRDWDTLTPHNFPRSAMSDLPVTTDGIHVNGCPGSAQRERRSRPGPTRGDKETADPKGYPQRKTPADRSAGVLGSASRLDHIVICASAASSSSATILVILIIGFTAGPAVSL